MERGAGSLCEYGYRIDASGSSPLFEFELTGSRGRDKRIASLPHDAGKVELLRPRVKLLKKIFTESDTPPLFPGMFLDE
jgi:hypothetical protein